ncbi:MAG: hypothetical protein H6718_01400 [Polyangiaceae bacterium]|nr:hypothetical protein [Myxococcales bacterium]MCB9584018.1 hypothetical protein [Polyangiaceae bacterium]MCB9607728.1 hypothetical protein [Polyangiaceae bacterium]
MESHVLVFGSLSFPARGVSAWRKLLVDAEAFDDWPDDLGHGSSGDGAPVAQLLKRIAAYPKSSHGDARVLLETRGRLVSWSGFLKEQSFSWLVTELVTAFRVASSVGAEGELYVVQVGEEYGYEIRVHAGGSSCASLDADALGALRDLPLSEQASELYVASFPRHEPVAAPSGSFTPVAPIRQRVVAAFECFEPEVVLRALVAQGGHFSISLLESVPVEQAFPDGKALLLAIRRQDPPWMSEAALRLLRQLDQETAVAAALDLLRSDAEDSELINAVRVLVAAEAGHTDIARAMLRPPLDQMQSFRMQLVSYLSDAKYAPLQVAEELIPLAEELASGAGAVDALKSCLQVLLGRQLLVGQATAKALKAHSDPIVSAQGDTLLKLARKARRP